MKKPILIIMLTSLFVIISCSEKKESKNNNWVNISNLKDFSDPLAAQYSIYSIPNSFLINREGIIVKSFKGYDEKSNKIEKEIEKLLNESSK